MDILDKFEKLWRLQRCSLEKSVDFFPEIFDERCEFHMTLGKNGWDGIGDLGQIFPTTFYQETKIVYYDPKVCVSQWTVHGKLEADLLDCSPSGQVVTYQGTSMHKLENGKITEYHDAWNFNAILMQLDSIDAPLPFFGAFENQLDIIGARIRKWCHLTPKEIFYACFWVNGRSLKDIAYILEGAVSMRTVEKHIANVMEKLKCHSRGELIDFLYIEKVMHHFRSYYDIALHTTGYGRKVQKKVKN